MRWTVIFLMVVALIATTAGAAHFAAAQRTGGVSYVRSINPDGKSAEIEFMVPVGVIYATDTGSMRPTFDDDALIVTEPENLAVGDVVVYESDKGYIVHRIVGIEFSGREPMYRLRGDNNLWDDGPVPASAIRWKVIGVLY